MRTEVLFKSCCSWLGYDLDLGSELPTPKVMLSPMQAIAADERESEARRNRGKLNAF